MSALILKATWLFWKIEESESQQSNEFFSSVTFLEAQAMNKSTVLSNIFVKNEETQVLW